MDSFLKLVRYTNEDPLDEKLKEKINDQFQKISIHDIHMEDCCNGSCGCQISTSFWQAISYGSIRLDVLKYMIDEKIIDLDNEELRNKLLDYFGSLLENSGICNTEEQCERVRETTMFLFPYLEKYIPDFRSPIHNESLIHFACYGYYHERKIEYIKRILDIGCPLVLKYPINKSIHKLKLKPIDDELMTQLDEVFAKTDLKEEYVRQSPIFLVAQDGYEELLERMLNMDKDTVNFHLQTYCVGYDCGAIGDEPRYIFYPMLPGLLLRNSRCKNPKVLEELARIMKTLINHGYNINLPIYYGNATGNHDLMHNITDFLNYYGYNYHDSPVMKVFNELKLPAPLDSESETNKSLDSKFKNFREMGPSRFDNEYTIILKKYEYIKDPNKYYIILEELEALLKKESPCDDGLRPDEWWPYIPGFETLAERINEFERQREEIIRLQQETNYRTRGE